MSDNNNDYDNIELDVCDLDKPTSSNIVYTTEAMEAAIEEYNKKIKNKTAVGTLGYSANTNSIKGISLDQVSHIVTEMYIKDYKVKATIKALDTSQGEILKQLLKDKVPVNLSMSSLIPPSDDNNEYKTPNKVTIIGTSVVVDSKR